MEFQDFELLLIRDLIHSGEVEHPQIQLFGKGNVRDRAHLTEAERNQGFAGCERRQVRDRSAGKPERFQIGELFDEVQ